MDSFLEACGATGPVEWTVEHRGSAKVERLTFDQPFLVVGRHPRSDLRLPHSEVSDRHAYLQRVGGRLFCVDLGSRSGLSINGRCHRAGWVEREATIRIGPYRLRLVRGDREPGEGCPVETDAPGGSTQPGVSLDLSHRSIRSSSCTIAEDLILVGSSAGCQARLLDPSVSGVHCALLQTPKGLWVVDLLGRGGVTINGITARIGRVTEGDELRVGDSRVRLPSPGGTDVALAKDNEYDRRPAPTTVPGLVSAGDLRHLLSGLPPEKAEIAESLLVPLANRFGLMQQQMFDRLQHAERERFQAFAAFQSEQFGALREELEQLRELRQEIDAMRDELRIERRTADTRDRSTNAAVTRPRLGSASAPVARDTPQPLAPPEPPSVLRIGIGEAS